MYVSTFHDSTVSTSNFLRQSLTLFLWSLRIYPDECFKPRFYTADGINLLKIVDEDLDAYVTEVKTSGLDLF